MRDCEIYISSKVTKMGSIIGHKIDYNGVRVLRGQRHISSKNWPKYPPGLGVQGDALSIWQPFWTWKGDWIGWIFELRTPGGNSAVMCSWSLEGWFISLAWISIFLAHGNIRLTQTVSGWKQLQVSACFSSYLTLHHGSIWLHFCKLNSAYVLVAGLWEFAVLESRRRRVWKGKVRGTKHFAQFEPFCIYCQWKVSFGCNRFGHYETPLE